MIVKTTELIEKEIEVELPVYFKDGGIYYAWTHERVGVAIYSTTESITVMSIIATRYKPELRCTRAEVEAAFKKVIKNIKSKI